MANSITTFKKYIDLLDEVYMNEAKTAILDGDNVPYASTIYFGTRKGRTLHMKNGTRLWDVKAQQDKKDLLVVQSMQNWIDRNL
ncbi:MAG: hypothetical protein SOZ34_05505 [Clostridia bacterium]|nr:hypothetical protein [Clostridia bacterium]